jgi:hypothetical protein
MCCLGSKEKDICVDCHERDNVVANRRTFCERNLTEHMPFCKGWVQVLVDEAKALKNVNLVFVYLYHGIVSNQDRVEFHINYWNQVMNNSTN